MSDIQIEKKVSYLNNKLSENEDALNKASGTVSNQDKLPLSKYIYKFKMDSDCHIRTILNNNIAIIKQ